MRSTHCFLTLVLSVVLLGSSLATAQANGVVGSVKDSTGARPSREPQRTPTFRRHSLGF